jgi:hypothetical protein
LGSSSLLGGKCHQITIEVSDVVYKLLEVLTKDEWEPTNVQQVVQELVDHAQQGVYWPGAWEREWLVQAFGPDCIEHLEPGDPYGREGGHMFQRPKWKRA